jgi:hypothetical protein
MGPSPAKDPAVALPPTLTGAGRVVVVVVVAGIALGTLAQDAVTNAIPTNTAESHRRRALAPFSCVKMDTDQWLRRTEPLAAVFAN